MYTVYADGHLLYHPDLVNNGYGIYNPTINYEANKSGSFQFKMPVTNVMYNSLTKMSSIITVYKDSEEIFRGRVLNDSRDYYNNKSVYVEGELAFLLDSIVRPVEWNGTISEFFTHIIQSHNEQVDASKRFTVGECTVLASNEITYSITDYNNCWNVFNSYLLDVYGGYIRTRVENGVRYIDYISSYNSTSDQVVQFGENLLDLTQYVTGENVITRLIPLGATYETEKEDNEITQGTKIIDYESEPVENKKKDNARTFTFAMEVLVNSKSKANETTNVTINFKVKVNDNKTLSWSGASTSKIYAVIKTKTDKKTTQRQKTGLGSVNWTSNYTTICTWTGDLKTAMTTISCEFVNNTSTKDNKPVSCGMSRYVDLLQQKTMRVDITSVTQGGVDYIVNQQAEDLFGQITGVQIWDDVETPSELLTKGEEYLNDNIALNVTLDVNAVDLNLLNVAYEKFKIGDRIRVVSAPHAVDNYFTCTAMSIDLQNPEQNQYTLGAEYKTLTETQIVNTNKIALTDDQINSIWEQMDEMTDIVQEANELIQTIYDQYADVTTVIENLDATYAEIDFANIGQAAIDTLMANRAFINQLSAKYLEVDLANITQATIENLVANTAFIDELTTNALNSVYADIEFAEIGQAAIDNLLTNTALVQDLTANYLDALYADLDFANIGTAAIENLTTNHLNAIYADVDFAYITEAAIQRLFAGTGLVNNLVIEEGHVTGTLAGVRITGDVIDANTIKADSLILQGDDGVYYKLNIDGLNNISTSEAAKFTLLTAKPADWETNWKDYYQITNNEYVHLTSNTAPTWAANRYYKLSSLYESGLDGSNIVARSLTANQIAAGTITASELNISSAKSGLGINDLETTVSGTVNSIAITYAYDDSTSTHPADSAFTYSDMPARVDGSYIWRKTVTSYVNGNSVTKYEMIQGIDGQDGQQGPQGNPGTSSYTHIRYSANSNGNPMSTTPNTYIGIYTGTSSTAPTSYTSYTWSKFQGTDGTNGTSYYVWLRYSANSDGSNMTTSPTSTTKYIGVYSGTSSTAPTSASSYTWSKYIGEDGESITISSKEIAYAKSDQGSSAPSSGWSTTFPTNLTNGDYLWTRTTVTYSSGGSTISYSVSYIGTNGTSPTAYDLRCSVYSVTKDTNNSDALSPTSVTFSSYSQTGNGTWGAYSGRFKIYTTTNNSTWTAVYTSSSNQSSYAYTVPSGIVGIKCELYLAGGTSTLVDSQTVPIISIGKNGTDGQDGQDGEDGKDAYTVILTNESHTFAATSDGKAIAGNTQVNVIAYKGATQVAATIGTISGLPTGMTAPITSNGTTSAYFTPTVTTSMVTKTGVLTVPITVDGKSFTKKFSYSLAIAGTGISSIAYKYLATQDQNKPQASAVNLDSIPTLSPTNKYLWQKETITYNNGTTSENVTLIGVYGDTGVGVESVEPLYYLQDDGMNIELNGNTKQTGKNLMLFNTNNLSGTANGITCSWNATTQSFSFSGTDTASANYAVLSVSNLTNVVLPPFKAGETYTISSDKLPNGVYYQINYHDTSSVEKSLFRIQGTGSRVTQTVTIPSDYSAIRVVFIGIVAATVTTLSASNITVQLEKSSSATTYEPYFGGIPSPSTPMPIHSVSGDNTVKVCGKNFANIDNNIPYRNTLEHYGNGLKVINTASGNNRFSSLILPNELLGKTISISANVSVSGEGRPSLRVYFVRSDGTAINNVGSYVSGTGHLSLTVTVPSEISTGANYLALLLYSSTSTIEAGEYAIFEDIQVEIGTATEYTPYQEQEYPINLPIKNYFDINTVYSDTSKFTIDGESVSGSPSSFNSIHYVIPSYLLNRQLTFQAYFNVQGTTTYMKVRAVVNGSNKDGANITNGNQGLSYVTFTPTTANDYVYITYGSSPGTITVSNIMLSIGGLNTFNSYSADSIELNKIGTYQDYIYKQDGEWYLHKETAMMYLNGTESWAKEGTNGSVYYRFYIAKNDMKRQYPNYNGLFFCNKIGAISNSNGNVDEGDYAIAGYIASLSYLPTQNWFYVLTKLSGAITTASELKTWLSSNPLTVYYVLATPTDTLIENDTLINQLDAIAEAYSYNGTTNILQENNDLPFNIIYNEQAGIAPDAPTPPVTSTTNAPDVWTKFTPAHIEGYRYYTCLQTKYDNNTYSVSNVVPDQELNEVHAQLTYIETQVTENHSLFEVLDDRISSQVTEITTVKGQVQDLNGTISETERTLREEITSSSTQTATAIRDEFTTRFETIEGDVSDIEEVTTFFEKTSDGLLIGKSNSNIRMELDNDSLDFINTDSQIMTKLDATQGLVTTKLAVGSTTEADKMWQIIPWGDGNRHLRFGKHN